MYMNYLLVTDLDGTLLDEKGELPKGAKEVFTDLAELDIKTAVVTARPKRLAEAFVKELGCDVAAYNNGAEIYRGENMLCSFPISSDFVCEFAKNMQGFNPDVMIGVEANGELFANSNMYSAWDLLDATRCDLTRFKGDSVSKILVGASNSSDIADIASFIKTEDVRVELAGSTALVTSSKASKAKAIEKIASMYDVDMSGVYVFGNDLSDVEMLRLAGHAYCVSSGHPMAKNYSTVVGSNNESGVLKAIQKFITGIKR